jgi:hypothetical protein
VSRSGAVQDIGRGMRCENERSCLPRSGKARSPGYRRIEAMSKK